MKEAEQKGQARRSGRVEKKHHNTVRKSTASVRIPRGSRSYPTSSSLQTSTPNTPFDQTLLATCGLCDRKYPAEDELWTHIRVHHLHQRSDALIGNSCGKCIRLTHDRRVPCLMCGQAFESEQEYDTHFARMHMNAWECRQDIQCGLCDARFTDPGYFITHIHRIHLNSIPRDYVMCQYCVSPLPTASLKFHLSAQHLTIQCLFCQKHFARLGYHRHMGTHST